MGCCYSWLCGDSTSATNSESGEHTHLLGDSAIHGTSIQRTSSSDPLGDLSQPKRSSEQDELNRILQEAATNVIDVAALDAHTLLQQEYVERVTQYKAKLYELCNAKRRELQNALNQRLLVDIPSTQGVLDYDNGRHEDLQWVINKVMEASEAMQKIRVECREQLVVPFVVDC